MLALALRRALGAPAALLAALAVAVDPFLITDSDLARGFMLEDLALLVAVWAMLHLRERITRRWALTFRARPVSVAVYTEYSRRHLRRRARHRRRCSPAWRSAGASPRSAALVLATLLPWIPEIVRAQNQDGISKLHPMFATAVAGRAAQRGRRAGGRARTAARRAVPGAGWSSPSCSAWPGCAAWILRRALAGLRQRAGGRTVALLAITGALTLIGHALAGPLGIDVFSQRYMTILVPVAAALGAAALLAAPVRWPALVAVLVLVALGAVSLVRRTGRAVRARFRPRPRGRPGHSIRARILTNTPIVVYYLRAHHPAFDRPSNLGPGLAGSCARPCLIIDDNRVYGGSARALTGPHQTIGPYTLTLEP